MKIFVRAKPGAREEYVREMAEGGLFDGNANKETGRRFVVSVKEPARDGRANRAIEKAVAAHFGISASRVHIVSGRAARGKVLDIDEI